ncbi:hypothetical protein [Bradyrhizobium sp. USDA 4508]
MTHTKDKLAAALRHVGLDEMAGRAATGYYDDYLSPLDSPCSMLVGELLLAADNDPERKDAILTLRKRAMGGEFDATTEESDAWAASLEGQETMRRLVQGR